MAEAMTKSPMKSVYASLTQDNVSSANKENMTKSAPKTTTAGSSISKPKTSSQAATRPSPIPHVSANSQNITKEVVLILKDLNQNLNVQNERIQKQDEKITSLSNNLEEFYKYYEVEDYDENFEESTYVDSFDDTETVNQPEPVSKRQKTSDSCNDKSVFKSLGEKFLQTETVDNEVNDDLASFVNNAFRCGINDEKQLELAKDIYRPSNCESLVKTRVNQGIWRLLKPHTQTDDSKLQSVQNYIVKAACNITKLLDKCGGILDSQDIEWGTYSLALLGQANKALNCRRKEMHKADLDPKYHYLASSSLPFTELLYGEDCDVNKNVREINDMNRIGRSMGRGYGHRGSANFRGRRPSRRGRGRGRWPRYDGPRYDAGPSASSSKNQKMAQRK